MKRKLSGLALGALCLLLAAAGCKGGSAADPVLKLSAEEALAQGKEFLAHEKYSRARPLFTHAFEVEPNSKVGREGLLLAADTYYLEGGSANDVQAEAKYRDYLNRFPTSEQAAYVQFQIANSLAKRMERADRDQTVTRKALESYQELIRLYPTSEYATRAQEQLNAVTANLAEHEYQIGYFYLRYGVPQAAVNRFEYLIQTYPKYGNMDLVIYNLGLAYQRVRKTQEAKKAFDRLRNEYPNSKLVHDIPKLHDLPEGKGLEMKQPLSKTLPHLAVLLLPLLLSGLAGCASGGGGDSAGERIQELQDRVLELQRKAAVTEVELARLRQQLGELMVKQGLSAAPGYGAASPASPASPMAQRRPAPAPPARTPRGPAIDETDIEVPVTQAGSPSPPRPQPAAPALAATPMPPAAGAVPPAVAGSKSEPATPAVQALYDRGYTLYHQKHYVDAEASFQRFLQAEPGSELADNAQYWIGECRYSRGDMRGALAAFREAVTRYPQGNKTPDALLKAGMSLEALGDKEGARTTYQEVLRRFPSTAVAAVAEERRAKLP